MIRPVQFVVGLLLLIIIEIARVYFIMPFPGSQRSETVELAYFIHTYLFWFRLIGLLIILFPTIHYITFEKPFKKVLVIVSIIIYCAIFYQLNYSFAADRMFVQSERNFFADSNHNVVNENQLVLGVEIKGEAKAYPIQLIGYHHQVRDTLAGKSIMVTYCTVCRTGRVFDPAVNGKIENFRLVGMDHFNAMFEDATSGTWWRQVNGEAVAGPLKGSSLNEIPSTQTTLRSWIERYPQTLILQPDSAFSEDYDELKGFDDGTIESNLIGRDSTSWGDRSWVVGVQIGMQARAYDWNELIKRRIINDTLNRVAIVMVMDSDSASFNVFQRDSLFFTLSSDSKRLVDPNTGSHWTFAGFAEDGPLKDTRLQHVQSYQEFWRSWKTFRPHTTQYHP